MDERRPSFWSTLPGILTGAAALITAITGGYLAFNRAPNVATQTPAGPSQTAATAAPTSSAPVPRPATPSSGEVPAMVVDPDGWTNLRSGPSTDAAIVGRINEGEIFWTKPQNEAWWPVRTAGGAEGYVHRSRVRLNP
jgi:uncharacterized protein YgiM (DUF1202 family)